MLAALREKRAALAGEGEQRAKAESLLAYGRRLRQITAEGSSDTSDLYDAHGLPE